MAIKIRNSSTSGCLAFRSRGGDIRIGLSTGKLESSISFPEEEIDEDDTKRESLKTGQYCGSLSQPGLGSQQGSPPGFPGGCPLGGAYTANIRPSIVLPELTEQDPFIDASLYDPGLIIATVGGYIYVNPERGTGKKSQGVFLGNNPTNALIVKSIGKLSKIVAGFQDRINGRITRWAFEDGTRVYLERPNQEPYHRIFSYYQSAGDYTVCPILPSQDRIAALSPSVFVPWYGFYWKIERHYFDVTGLGGKYGYCAVPSGCITQPNFIKWGKEFYLRCEIIKDYQYYAISGIPESFFGNYSMRMGRIGFDMECDVSTVSSSNYNIMSKYYVNLIRNCEEQVHVVVADSSVVLGVAEAYAQNMATNKFLAHVDPNTGKDMLDRLEDAGVTDSNYVGEILCTVTEDEMSEDGDVAYISVNDRWRNSPPHFLVMIDSVFYKAAFGRAFCHDDRVWYCCGMFRSTDGDEALMDTSDVIFPEAVYDVQQKYKMMAWGQHDSALPHTIRSVYSAFSTIPDDELSVSALCYEVFSSSPWPYGQTGLVASVPDHHKRAITVSSITGPGEQGVIGGIEANYEQHESQDGWIANKGQTATAYRRFYEGSYGSYGFTKFYIEYDSSRDIMLKLYDIKSVVIRGNRSQYIDPNFVFSDRPDSISVSSQQPPMRTSPLLQEGETEPTLGGSLDRGGDTELWIGNFYINNASDSTSGTHINPFQTINVTSVFHSNSGYTCVTYTRTKTLYNSWVYWKTNTPNGYDPPPASHNYGASEKYWWLRQSLWCAVVTPSGSVLANFEVKGTVPHRSDQGVDIDYKPWQETYYQPDDISMTINIQAGGIIKVGTLEIWAFHIEGKQLIIKEEENDGVYSFYVYQGDATKFDSATVEETTGTISVTFNVPPDIDSQIIFYAEVSDFDSIYAPIHHYSEHVCYAVVEYFESDVIKTKFISHMEIWYGGTADIYGNLKTVSFDGLMPINPNASITEDGEYLVLGFTTAWAKIKNLPGRVPMGLTGNANHENWFGKFAEPVAPTINYQNESLTQVIVLDLTDISSGEPKLVHAPFLFPQLAGHLTETIVLN